MAIQSNAADIHLRSSQAIGLSAQSQFSITTWINANWSGGARTSFVGFYGPATDIPLATPVTAVQIGSTNGGGELTCWTWGGGTLVGTPAGTMTAYNNTWVFISYTFDGTTHSLYRNGILMSTSTTAQIAGFLNQVYINGFPGGGTNEVAAFQIDHYALFRRVLSANEILTMFNAGGARHGINNNIICRFECDELAQGTSCTSVPDLSGNGMNLSSTGAGAAMTYTYTSSFANANIRPVQ